MGDDKLVLTYFNSRGRAEMLRILMKYADIPFEDKRIGKEEWEHLKPKVPTGQLPMLEVNGTKLCQSVAIGRFLADKAGIAGKTRLEQAQSEVVVHTINDVVNMMVLIMFEEDEARKKMMSERFEEEFLPLTLKKLEFMLRQNGGKWFVGDELTWADVALGVFLDPEGFSSRLKKVDVRATAPALLEHANKVNDLDRIRKWREERPPVEQ